MNNLVNNFARYLFVNITGLDSDQFDELGDYDTIYWMEMSRNTVKHAAMLNEFIDMQCDIG